MVKFSRYILVLIAILSLSMALPRLYWMMFEKPIKAPSIFYSCIDNEFLMIRPAQNSIKTNEKGDEISRNEFEKRLPLNYNKQLTLNGTMPDSINGVEMDFHEISRNRSFFRIRPKDIDTPRPSLYPLIESQSGRANLEMPDDFFRITWRMEFIDATTNKINEEKSRMFSAVLYKRGFQFPAKSINGIPITRKSCDEGYLVIDNADQLFHIKMVEGKPFVRKAEIPEGIRFKHIACVDFNDKLYYAYLFSTDHKVYVLTQYDYLLEQLEVEDIHPELHEIRILGDLLNYSITSVGEGFVECTVLDKDFKFVDNYKESWLTKEERIEGKIAQLLFPFELSLKDKSSSYNRLFTVFNSSFYWVILNLILMLIHWIMIRKYRIKNKNHFIDFVIIAITGIFGFIAVNFFPNKF